MRHLTIFFLITISFFAQAQPGKNTVLVVLQENGGSLSITSSIPQPAKGAIEKVIDGIAENFENIKTSLHMAGRYERVILLTDNQCTKANLLTTLIAQSKAGKTVDLLLLGHGGLYENSTTPLLYLKDEHLNGNDINTLLTEAKRREGNNFKFNLRLVYLCNCYGGLTQQNWLGIGAKTVVGCPEINYMPEPQISYFFQDFVINGKTATAAANDSWSASRPFFSLLPDLQVRPKTGDSRTRIDFSKLLVYGDRNLRFAANRLAVNETKTYTISAKQQYNHTGLYMVAGERYQFSVPSTSKWKNGNTQTTAAGYNPSHFDFARRQTSYNMMTLVGEVFSNTTNTSYDNTHFKIGTSATWNVNKTGYLMCHANDVLAGYGDNSGTITLTVKRLK